MPASPINRGADLRDIKPDYDPTETIYERWFYSREWQEFLGVELHVLPPALEKERQEALARAAEGENVISRAVTRDMQTNPSPQVVDSMCALILQGCFPWVAASAVGIGRQALKHLQETNEDVMHAIETSHGTARASAEMRVYASNPEFWLQKGPGKQRPDAPGWGEERALTGAGGADLPAPVTTNNHLSISVATNDELEQLEQLYDRWDARARGALPLESPATEME
jgi:hypothetical protein